MVARLVAFKSVAQLVASESLAERKELAVPTLERAKLHPLEIPILLWSGLGSRETSREQQNFESQLLIGFHTVA